MTNNNRYTTLATALTHAMDAAQAYANTEDGGTCNMDAVVIDYKSMQMTKSHTIAIINAAGLDGYDISIHGSKCILVDGISHGQGNRNTRMAQAAAHSLQHDGIAATMYYQID